MVVFLKGSIKWFSFRICVHIHLSLGIRSKRESRLHEGGKWFKCLLLVNAINSRNLFFRGWNGTHRFYLEFPLHFVICYSILIANLICITVQCGSRWSKPFYSESNSQILWNLWAKLDLWSVSSKCAWIRNTSFINFKGMALAHCLAHFLAQMLHLHQQKGVDVVKDT